MTKPDAGQTPASNSVRPDTARVLAGLKPFQRQSVEYVFDRLYGEGYTRRFLVADEVGLGKTLVARGVIARTIDHLWDKVDRVDVVYICSNHDIARQNINRLNVTGKKDFAMASRITLLPISQGSDRLRDQRLNFVSFTPGTSFELKSSLGVSTERTLLYHLLKDSWSLRGAAPANVLRGDCTPESFRRQLDQFDHWYKVDEGMRAAFLASLAGQPQLREQFNVLCERFHRSDANVPAEVSRQRGAWVGAMRAVLARSCLHALQPDLIILDEFQRFKQLLAGDAESEASRLAHDLFRYSNEHTEARVLMLSATPYKMYTMGHESGEDDHYADFLDTVRFLLDDKAQAEKVEHLLGDYRRLLYRLGQPDAFAALEGVRDKLQAILRRVMCRTERLAVTADRSGMLREIPSVPSLCPGDVESYVGLQGLARALDHQDTIEYWKSAPYLVGFMEEYALKRELRQRADEPDVVAAFATAARRPGVQIPWEDLEHYRQIESHHPRLRKLIEDTVDNGAWEALWVPPAIPYYNLNGALADLWTRGFTKRLVFSSWQVVPKAIAALVSYEAERRIISRFDPKAANTPEARKAMRPLLNFTRSKGRLSGMPVLGLMYPSSYLAQRFDPLRYMCEQPSGCRLDVSEVIGLVEMGLSEALTPILENATQEGPDDESWYWAAPILLDLHHHPGAAETWWADEALAERWLGRVPDEEDIGVQDGTVDGDPGGPEDAGQGNGDEGNGWHRHVDEARRMTAQWRQMLGRPPADLATIVAQFAIAGPAVVALRALARISGGLGHAIDPHRRHMAGKIAAGFRSLFNAPDVIALVRGQNPGEPYWRRVLNYCLAGCIQAVLDEYVHVLCESLGDADVESALLATDVGGAVATALELRIASPGADRITIEDDGVGADSSGGASNGSRLLIKNERLRARFAMRFGDEKDGDGKTVSRADQVRTAFNSPFWPFVLATTSVGQEGLDFHTYCHAVMHWNLPANPVDMEQREGRVHRYKGHAVRRNVAKRHASSLAHDGCVDPWARLFDMAASEASDPSGLTPYWVYTAEGGAVIERHVPALPLSREADRLPALRNSLALYRMVFGQPRQDDLVEFLRQRVSSDALKHQLDQLRLDLTPSIVG